MSAITWSHQVGDPRRFAWRVALVSDHAGDAAVGEALRQSWGLFELWADGVNLCAHEEQGEKLQAAHWYLLPVAEWLIANWNPLFHEQRLPLPDEGGAAATAARALTQLEAFPDRSPVGWGLPAEDERGRLVAFQEWAQRHRLESAAPEGPLPNVWLRRVGGDLEVSLGRGNEELFDGALLWTAAPTTAYISVEECARTTERALRALLVELIDRDPLSSRAVRAAERLDQAVAGTSDDERLAWLVGLGGDTGRLAGIRGAIDEIGADASRPSAGSPSVALTAVPVATLFGSLSPAVTEDDVRALVGVLRRARRPDGLAERLDRLAATADPSDFAGLGDGEAGGELGDALSTELDDDNGQIQITRFVTGHLGLTVLPIWLSDASLRAVTLLHDDGRAAIALNSGYERGTAGHVARFSLAHELAHLVYDRVSGRRLAIASGPWTPIRIERRANGFAAGLLMPERLLRLHIGHEPDWPREPLALARVASALGVGVTALAERMQNVGMLSRAAADGLLDALLGQAPGAGSRTA